MAIRTPSPRAWFLRLTALALAALTAQTVFTSVTRLRDQASALGPAVGVVIAQHDLSLGSRVTAHDVRLVQRHRSQVPRGSLDRLTLAVGRVVRVPVLAGVPVLSANLVMAHGGEASAIPSGYRALRVVDHAGLVASAGQVVDVIASFAPQTNDAGATAASGEATVVARGAIVIADTATQISHDNSPKFSASAAESGMIVLVKDREASSVAFAAAFGVLSIVLAPPEEACCVAT